MIEVKYGLLPKENFCKYFEFLINKTYKILPLKEEKSDTLKSYLESYLRELIGNQELVSVLVDEPKFITVLNTMQFLISEEYSDKVCKKEVFKCIRILEEIKDNNYNYKITIQDIRNHFLGVTLLDETKAILAVIFRDYWATNYQRKKIIEKENHDKQKDKNEKFDFDNLFKKKEKEF